MDLECGREKEKQALHPQALSKVLVCSDHSQAPSSPCSTKGEDEDVLSDLLHVLIPLSLHPLTSQLLHSSSFSPPLQTK